MTWQDQVREHLQEVRSELELVEHERRTTTDMDWQTRHAVACLIVAVDHLLKAVELMLERGEK